MGSTLPHGPSPRKRRKLLTTPQRVNRGALLGRRCEPDLRRTFYAGIAHGVLEVAGGGERAGLLDGREVVDDGHVVRIVSRLPHRAGCDSGRLARGGKPIEDLAPFAV